MAEVVGTEGVVVWARAAVKIKARTARKEKVVFMP